MEKGSAPGVPQLGAVMSAVEQDGDHLKGPFDLKEYHRIFGGLNSIGTFPI